MKNQRKTRLLFGHMLRMGVPLPVHSASGLPSPKPRPVTLPSGMHAQDARRIPRPFILPANRSWAHDSAAAQPVSPHSKPSGTRQTSDLPRVDRALAAHGDGDGPTLRPGWV